MRGRIIYKNTSAHLFGLLKDYQTLPKIWINQRDSEETLRGTAGQWHVRRYMVK